MSLTFRQIIGIGLVCGLIAGYGCQPQNGSTETGYPERLYRQNCLSCHSLPDPASLTDQGWEDLMQQHDKRMKLDTTNYRIILNYLKLNN